MGRVVEERKRLKLKSMAGLKVAVKSGDVSQRAWNHHVDHQVYVKRCEDNMP